MSVRVYRNLARESVTLVLSRDFDFQDHEVLQQAAVELRDCVRRVELDLSALPDIPLWLMGLILQVEDAIAGKARLRVIRCSRTVEKMLRLAFMERFLPRRGRRSKPALKAA